MSQRKKALMDVNVNSDAHEPDSAESDAESPLLVGESKDSEHEAGSPILTNPRTGNRQARHPNDGEYRFPYAAWCKARSSSPLSQQSAY